MLSIPSSEQAALRPTLHVFGLELLTDEVTANTLEATVARLLAGHGEELFLCVPYADVGRIFKRLHDELGDEGPDIHIHMGGMAFAEWISGRVGMCVHSFARANVLEEIRVH